MQKKGNDEKLYTLYILRGRSPMIYKATLRCKSGFTLGRVNKQGRLYMTRLYYIDEVDSVNKILTVTVAVVLIFPL